MGVCSPKRWSSFRMQVQTVTLPLLVLQLPGVPVAQRILLARIHGHRVVHWCLDHQQFSDASFAREAKLLWAAPTREAGSLPGQSSRELHKKLLKFAQR